MKVSGFLASSSSAASSRADLVGNHRRYYTITHPPRSKHVETLRAEDDFDARAMTPLLISNAPEAALRSSAFLQAMQKDLQLRLSPPFVSHSRVSPSDWGLLD